MRTLVLFIGLTAMLTWYLPLGAFHGLLPAEMFVYPRRSMTNAQYMGIAVLVQWVIPGLAAGLFLWWSRLAKRVEPGVGLTLFGTGVAIYVAQWAAKFLAAFVPGGGGLYAVGILVSYLALPLKVLLLVGAVKLLMNLRPPNTG